MKIFFLREEKSFTQQVLGVKKELLLFFIFNNFFTTFMDDNQILVVHSR